MVYKYEWKTGFYKIPAEEVGKHMENLQREKGEVTCENLLDSARPEDSVIHSLYEWDDSAAAEKYRLEQSRKIIGNLVRVTVVESSKPEEKKIVRAFVNVSEQKGVEKAIYIDTETALSQEKTRAIVLRNALSELIAFKKKYKNFHELASVFEAIDDTQLKLKFDENQEAQ